MSLYEYSSPLPLQEFGKDTVIGQEIYMPSDLDLPDKIVDELGRTWLKEEVIDPDTSKYPKALKGYNSFIRDIRLNIPQNLRPSDGFFLKGDKYYVKENNNTTGVLHEYDQDFNRLGEVYIGGTTEGSSEDFKDIQPKGSDFWVILGGRAIDRYPTFNTSTKDRLTLPVGYTTVSILKGNLVSVRYDDGSGDRSQILEVDMDNLTYNVVQDFSENAGIRRIYGDLVRASFGGVNKTYKVSRDSLELYSNQNLGEESASGIVELSELKMVKLYNEDAKEYYKEYVGTTRKELAGISSHVRYVRVD